MNEFLLFMNMPGGMEWIVILVVALLIFGPRLPSVMRSLGKGIVEFKKGIRDIEDDVDGEIDKASTDNKVDNDSKKHLTG